MKRSDLLVLRHSERVDEANLKLWHGVIDFHYPRIETKKKTDTATSSFLPYSSASSIAVAAAKREKLRSALLSWFTFSRIDLIESIKRDIRSFMSDPVLFEPRGLEIADDAAETLHRIVSSVIPDPQPGQLRIFCSKLRRCVQTAVPLARRFNLPIVLSTGLAQFIVLVRRQKGHFQFIPISEWQFLYPDITFIDGDLSLEEAMCMPAIPVDDWWRCLDMITSNPPLNAGSLRRIDIIVGHRETIKELAGMDGSLPYCAIGYYNTRTFRPRSVQVVHMEAEAEQEEAEAAAAAVSVDIANEKEGEEELEQSQKKELSFIKSILNMSLNSNNSADDNSSGKQSLPSSKLKASTAPGRNSGSEKNKKLKRTKKKKRLPAYEEICPLRKVWDSQGNQLYPHPPV